MKCSMLLFLTVFTASLTNCLSTRLLKKKGNVIKLERQGLTEIPESVFLTDNVTELHLYGNRLDSLPARIGELKELKKLYGVYPIAYIWSKKTKKVIRRLSLQTTKT